MRQVSWFHRFTGFGDHFGFILEAFWLHFEAWGPLGDHFGIILSPGGPLGEHFGSLDG